MKKQTTKDLDSYLALESTVNTLMGPGGCPWDKQQTHESLKKNLLEECYELLEAIDNKDSKNIAEELGDILLQIALHIHLGTNNGEFNKQDVLLRCVTTVKDFFDTDRWQIGQPLVLSDIAYELSLVDGVATVVPPADNNPDNLPIVVTNKFKISF